LPRSVQSPLAVAVLSGLGKARFSLRLPDLARAGPGGYRLADPLVVGRDGNRSAPRSTARSGATAAALCGADRRCPPARVVAAADGRRLVRRPGRRDTIPGTMADAVGS